MGNNHVKAKPPLEALNQRWEKADSGCWLWTGSVFNHGYGYFSSSYYGKKWCTTAHRASYILHKGDIPEGMVVCHSCDTPLCVNPDHLFLGTDRDNVHDAISKGRFQSPGNPCYQSGDQRSRARLTSDKVRAMRDRHKSGQTVAALAVEFGVPYETARHAIKGISWKSVA